MPTIFSREILLRWLLAFGCFAAVLFFFSPSWGAFTLWARVPEMSGMLEVRRGVSVLAQVAHPGAEIADPLHRVIQWRLLFPLVGYAFNLPTPVFFALADVGCVAVLGYIITLLRRRGAAWWPTAAAAVILGAASWVFVSTGWLGYFDSWLALGLLVVAFAPNRWSVWAACLWAPWVDERFVLAAPLAFFCRYLYLTRETGTPGNLPPPFAAKKEFTVPAAMLAAFLFVRLGLLSGNSASNATVAGYFAGKNYLDAPIGRILLGVWEGLRAGWILVLAAIVALRARPPRAALLAGAVLAMIVVGLATAQDYSRSMTMLLPVGVLGALLLVPEATSRRLRIVFGALACALVLPAHHVMNDRVNPIFYLYHELASLESPPPAAMPELRELKAVHLMEEARFAEAETELTLAMKLSDHPASAAKHRGMLYVSGRRWEDAKRDFTIAIEDEPDNPDGWFLRAQVELALRDNDAAKADFDHARAVAEPAWLERPDVKAFTALYNRQTGQR